jgi:hypothetical protein
VQSGTRHAGNERPVDHDGNERRESDGEVSRCHV